MSSLEDRVARIEKRNSLVESDKKWEISFVRRFFLTATIFSFALLFLWITGQKNILLGAIIPPIGYFFSTLSLPFLRKLFQKS